MAAVEAVVPGTRLGSVSEYAAGEGAYVNGSDIFASVAGFKQVKQPEQQVNVRSFRHWNFGAKPNFLNFPWHCL